MVMTYEDIMARWRTVNRRMGTLFVMPFLFLVGFSEFASVDGLNPAIAWSGLILAWILISLVYGDLTDEFYKISSWADAYKLEWLIEDLGLHAENMPVVAIATNQEMGNLRYPSRLVLVMRGCNHPIVYDWQKRRFARYKWPILPFSMTKAITRAQQQT